MNIYDYIILMIFNIYKVYAIYIYIIFIIYIYNNDFKISPRSYILIW